MDLRSVFQLSLRVTAANGNGIQLVGSDSPRKNLLVASLSIEVPLSVPLHDGDREWPFLTAHHESGATGILGVNLHGFLLVSLGGEGEGDFFVRDRIGA